MGRWPIPKRWIESLCRLSPWNSINNIKSSSFLI